jgi:hypothetical protein
MMEYMLKSNETTLLKYSLKYEHKTVKLGSFMKRRVEAGFKLFTYDRATLTQIFVHGYYKENNHSIYIAEFEMDRVREGVALC